MRRAGVVLALLIDLVALGACSDEPPLTDPSWVGVYEPRAASPGFNLTLFRRRLPLLIDLNGNTVHRWDVVAIDRVRLLRDGHLLAIGTDHVVREYDWDGTTVWEFRLPGEDFPHHDVIRLENGNNLVLAHDVAVRLDYLLEVDDAGRVVWEWRAAVHLTAEIERVYGGGHPRNATHVNSIQELAPNRWFDQGDARFRPGNILISARNLNAIYVIDKATKETVWRFDRGLDRQHEAIMVPRGYPGEGHVLLFNNGLEDRYGYRSTSVLEIDPATGAEVWSYRAPHFFSSTGGTQQILPNGNVMVTSSRGGRVFELDRRGRIVWQWSPTFLPMRDARYAEDHCPQLAALGRAAPRRVERSARHHVDHDLYDFALAHQTRRRQIGGRERNALTDPNTCRVVLLPERPAMTVRFGFTTGAEPASREDGIAAAVSDEADAGAVKAAVRLAPVGANVKGGPARVLFEREVRFAPDPERPSWLGEESIDLRDHALEPIELCFAAHSPDGGPPDPRFFWLDPVIRSAGDSDEPGDAGALTEPSAERERRLQALGYVD